MAGKVYDNFFYLLKTPLIEIIFLLLKEGIFMKKRVMIAGYGTVAKELVKLILENSDKIKAQYRLEFVVTGIAGSKGMLFEKDGIQLHKLAKMGIGSEALLDYSQNLKEPTFDHDVLVDCTPTNIENGEPGLTYILKAIDAGMDVVSVSKGALFHSFKEIKQRSVQNGTRLKYSGATAAALPTIDIGEYSLAGSSITKIEGILNGTSNFILTSMNENGLSFEESLQIAQKKGIAEANPVLDVKGFDSACKLLLLANSLLGADFSLEDIKIAGIENLTKADMEKAKKRENRIKLLASARKEKGQFTLEVAPCELSQDHPLIHVNGTNKGILFETVEMGEVCCTGGASHPRGAAAAALKDLINLYR
jgi:homoserine dehydrogenase